MSDLRHKSKRGWIGDRKGMILPIALIFLVVLSIMGIAAIMTATSTTGLFGGLRRADEALYNAEAGVEVAKRIIAQENPNFDQVYANAGQLPGLEGTVSYGNGSYTVLIVNNEDDPGFGSDLERDGRYIVHSTGRVSDAVKTLEVVVESFSRFFYFTEWEEAPGTAAEADWVKKFVFFRTGDNLDGPVHSNHALHIGGNPVFTALASSNESPYKLTGSADDSAIFLGGSNWSRYVSLPVGPDGVFGTADDLVDVKTGADAKGTVIDTYDTGTAKPWDYRVHFRGDRGPEVDIHKKDPADADWTFVETLTIGAGFNGVVYFHGGGPVHVGGKIKDTGSDRGKLSSSGVESTVQGRWTICSASESTDLITTAGELQVEGDIKYEGNYTAGGDPFPSLDPDDPPQGLLGLVSANNVVIKENLEDDAQAIRANGITIHASIMATSNENATFSVETALIDGVPGSLNRPINLLGGIIQSRRGVVGIFDIVGLITGFDKNYMYDPRLYYMTPPSFPLALNLKVKSWKE